MWKISLLLGQVFDDHEYKVYTCKIRPEFHDGVCSFRDEASQQRVILSGTIIVEEINQNE